MRTIQTLGIIGAGFAAGAAATILGPRVLPREAPEPWQPAQEISAPAVQPMVEPVGASGAELARPEPIVVERVVERIVEVPREPEIRPAVAHGGTSLETPDVRRYPPVPDRPEPRDSLAPEPASASPEPRPREPEAIELPAGTVLQATLGSGISSATAKAGDPVRASLSEDIVVGGRTVLPSGAWLEGIVEEAESAKRIKGNGGLKLRFTRLVLEDGYRSAMNATWEGRADGKLKRDAAIVGGSAAGGALLGQILGEDSESTVGGAVLGGAIGTAVVLSNKGRELELAPGDRLVLSSDSPITLPAVDGT